MKRVCYCCLLVLLLVSCSHLQQRNFEEQDEALSKALKTLGKEGLTATTTHVLVVTLQGCGGCTSQILSHYKQIVTSTWLVVFCANDPVIARGLLSSHSIPVSGAVIDTRDVMIKNRLVDHAPVVFRVKDKRIVYRYDLDLENFAESIEHIKHDSW